MVFNKILLDYANRVNFGNYNYYISHEWIYLFCLALDGKICRDSNSYILYRRHSNATTYVGQGINKRIKSEFKQMNKAKNDKLYLSKGILDNYKNDLSKKNLKKITIVSNYKKSFYRLRLVFGRFLNSGNILLNIRIKFFVLIGKF